MVFIVFEATMHSQCYKVNNLLQSLNRQKLTKEKLRLGLRAQWRKYILKGLLSVLICKPVMPYITHKIYEDGSVTVKDHGNSKVFTIKSKELSTMLVTEKASEMESLMLAEP